MVKNEIIQALQPNGFFYIWMPTEQRMALLDAVKGEEGAYFVELLHELKMRIEAMPKTRETDGQGDKAIVWLHYFRGRCDAWITEKDMGDGTSDTRQHQAFGKISLTGNKEDAELGYISIEELIMNGVELDLYWTPKPLREPK